MEKRAYVFPGQGAQFVGMGHDLYQSSKEAKRYFDLANDMENKFNDCRINGVFCKQTKKCIFAEKNRK